MTFFEFLANSPLLGVYFVCATFGGSLILLQLLLMMFGFGGTDEASDFGDAADHVTADIFQMLSLRTLTAGIAFFGIGGLAGWTGTNSLAISVLIAVISGLIAIYAVYYLYLSVAKMKTDGSLSEKTLVGASGSVYVRVPAAKSGIGKVLVAQQGRTVEYEAMTAGEELKSGTPIVVVAVISTTTVEVTGVGAILSATT